MTSRDNISVSVKTPSKDESEPDSGKIESIGFNISKDTGISHIKETDKAEDLNVKETSPENVSKSKSGLRVRFKDISPEGDTNSPSLSRDSSQDSVETTEIDKEVSPPKTSIRTSAVEALKAKLVGIEQLEYLKRGGVKVDQKLPPDSPTLTKRGGTQVEHLLLPGSPTLLSSPSGSRDGLSPEVEALRLTDKMFKLSAPRSPTRRSSKVNNFCCMRMKFSCTLGLLVSCFSLALDVDGYTCFKLVVLTDCCLMYLN